MCDKNSVAFFSVSASNCGDRSSYFIDKRDDNEESVDDA